MNDRYSPVKLSPAFKDYLWGGTKLKTVFQKETDLDPVAESWELSAHRDGESTVASGSHVGKTLSRYLEEIGKEALGKKAECFDYFPLLIKFIDAKSNLSVQVHPDDAYALAVEGEYGKTEMWYVLDAEPDAFLYYGFKRDLTREEYEDAIRKGSLTDLLCRVSAKAGDVFFIPAGTVHAIGAGLLICEIQQNSNTTYRVFDYNRRDKSGNTRPLHIEKALEVSSLRRSPERTPTPDGEDVLLATSEYFTVRRLRIKGTLSLHATPDSFISLTVTAGKGNLQMEDSCLSLVAGDSIFIPAGELPFTLTGELEIIRSTL